MTLSIAAFFSTGGAPATELTPTIDIWRLSDNSLAVNDGAMIKVGGGFYKYSHVPSVANDVDHAWIIDGGGALSAFERYKFGSNQQWATSVVDGLVGDNQVIRVLSKNPNGDALTQRIRDYATELDATTDNGVTGLLNEYNVVATYDVNNKLETFRMTRVGS